MCLLLVNKRIPFFLIKFLAPFGFKVVGYPIKIKVWSVLILLLLGENVQLIKAFISLTQISFIFQKEQQVSQTYRESEIHNIYVGLEIKKNSWKYKVDRQQ